MHTKILVPLDGTVEVESALGSARTLARLGAAAVVLVRVVPHKLGGREATAALDALERTAADLRASGLAAEARLVWGEPADGIVGAVATGAAQPGHLHVGHDQREPDRLGPAERGLGAVGLDDLDP